MSAHLSAAEKHDAALDEANRVHFLKRHEDRIRGRERLRLVGPLVQHPHAFQTPIPRRYEPLPSGDHLDAPGAMHTDFPGCVI